MIGDAVESAHMALDDAVEEAVGEAEAAREEEDKLNEHYDANVRKFISDAFNKPIGATRKSTLLMTHGTGTTQLNTLSMRL